LEAGLSRVEPHILKEEFHALSLSLQWMSWEYHVLRYLLRVTVQKPIIYSYFMMLPITYHFAYYRGVIFNTTFRRSLIRILVWRLGVQRSHVMFPTSFIFWDCM
jgi:hypothetical protein